MLKRIISYLFTRQRGRSHKHISQKELEEYMRIEGISYGDMLPPNRKEK